MKLQRLAYRFGARGRGQPILQDFGVQPQFVAEVIVDGGDVGAGATSDIRIVAA